MSSSEPTPITYYSWFPGEDFLSVALPNYQMERRRIVFNIIVVIIIFIFVLPYFLATKRVANASSSDGVEENTVEKPQILSPSKKTHNNKRRNGKKDKQQHKPSVPQQSTHTHTKETKEVVEFSSLTSNMLTLLCIICIFGVLFFSENNLFPSRTILQVPVFTKDECKYIIEMANAAERNVENSKKERELLMVENPGLENVKDTSSDNRDNRIHNNKLRVLDSTLSEPPGWKKGRHNAYPTTDLNLVTDPFTNEDRAWLADRLNARLAPIIERGFGIYRGAVRATDIFVVRYDADKGQANLRKHTDASHLSFNVLLNDEFEGGGTRFHNRVDGTYYDVKPDVGEGIISHAEIQHEGLATTKGTRYILVGFDSIDAKDPLTGETTYLSIFSSWLNFSWMAVRFKEGVEDGTRSRSRTLNEGLDGEWKHSRYAVSLFRDLYHALTRLVDLSAPLSVLKVVSEKDFDKYIEVMDDAQQRKESEDVKLGKIRRSLGYPSWYNGQQIDLDVFGNYRTSWITREVDQDKFRGENL